MTCSGAGAPSSSIVSWASPSWRARWASSRRRPLRPIPDAGSAPSSASTVGATSTSRHDSRHEAPSGDARAGEDEGRPGLHDVDRSVLAPVAALVLPVVGRGVDRDQVGSARRVEELGHLLVGVRVGVHGAVRDGGWPARRPAGRTDRWPGRPGGSRPRRPPRRTPSRSPRRDGGTGPARRRRRRRTGPRRARPRDGAPPRRSVPSPGRAAPPRPDRRRVRCSSVPSRPDASLMAIGRW